MGDKPSRAFRHKSAQQQNCRSDNAADAKAEPPSQIDRKNRLVQQERRRQRAARRTKPEAAVDDEVDPAAIFCRDELVDGGVHRCILPANSEPCQQAEKGEAPEIPGEGAEQDAGQINRKGDIKNEPASKAVGGPAEDEGACDGADYIERRDRTQRGARQAKRVVALQRGSERAHDSHFKTVQDPCDPEAEHDKQVEAAPGQAVKPERDVGLDGCVG